MNAICCVCMYVCARACVRMCMPIEHSGIMVTMPDTRPKGPGLPQDNKKITNSYMQRQNTTNR